MAALTRSGASILVAVRALLLNVQLAKIAVRLRAALMSMSADICLAVNRCPDREVDRLHTGDRNSSTIRTRQLVGIGQR
jgi:hypothetical protein